MPYIRYEDQLRVDVGSPETSGELNYKLTICCLKYLETWGQRYQHYNTITAALERVKASIGRTDLGPYVSYFTEGLKRSIADICLEYIRSRASEDHYDDTMDDLIGALENCKLEFYRRSTGPYEDLKIIENGDVYPRC